MQFITVDGHVLKFSKELTFGDATMVINCVQLENGTYRLIKAHYWDFMETTG